MVASEAADFLVGWLGGRFGEDGEMENGGEFGRMVVGRMVGTARGSAGLGSSSAEKEITLALDFDDSLFAAEEQNLFIDEVRETGRWSGAFASMSVSAGVVAGGPGSTGTVVVLQTS